MTKFLMVQGTSSGAGKTTLVTALCRIFSEEGYHVAPFKAQNMSNYSYSNNFFQISRAQFIQGLAARCQINSDLNPILLKPLGDYVSTVYLNGKKWRNIHASEYYNKFVNNEGMQIVTKALGRLQKKHDLIILEGAGSPAEINLSKFDIANMKIAYKIKSPVLLITDIDKGGSFASMVGTLSLIDKKYQKLVKGFVFNKFRGDEKILKPGFKKLNKITNLPILGLIPMLKFNLPEEDSLGVKAKSVHWTKKNLQQIEREIEKLKIEVKKNLNINEIRRLIN